MSEIEATSPKVVQSNFLNGGGGRNKKHKLIGQNVPNITKDFRKR